MLFLFCGCCVITLKHLLCPWHGFLDIPFEVELEEAKLISRALEAREGSGRELHNL